jgi:hypothetical protein
VFQSGCSFNQGDSLSKKDEITAQPYVARNRVSVPGQKLPSGNIRSITFYKNNHPGAAPIIRLNSDDQLELQFDDMSSDANSFTVRITHQNQDWSESSLNPVDYSTNYEDQITNGVQSKANNPPYTHYKYLFPNRDFKPKVSGNYLLHIYDFSTGKELFSLPFFVTEQKKMVKTHIETLYNQGTRYLRHNQLFATYDYPNFVEFPQLDLSIEFVQNQFWGRARKAGIKDISQPGVIKFHDSRNNLFVATYEFRQLDLDPLDGNKYRVLSYRPETIPPEIVLRRDVVNLDINPPERKSYKFGEPNNNRDSEYANVHFSLEVPSSYKVNGPIYIYGSFNNWSIQDENKMQWDTKSAMYKGQAFIKEGKYDYKYAVLKNGEVDDLRLDASFAATKQQYFTFVYFRDPQMHYDRLLSYNSTYSQ